MRPAQPMFQGRYVNEAIVVIDPPWSGSSGIKQPESNPEAAKDRRCQPGLLLNGSPVDFRARLVVIGCGNACPDLEADVNLLAEGTATFRFTGLVKGGAVVCRYFTLAPGQSLRLDVTAYSEISVYLVACTAREVACYAMPIAGRADADKQAICAVEHLAAGTFYVPPGASLMIAGTNDALFNWRTPLDATRTVSIPVAVVAPNTYNVAGCYYSVVTVPFRAVFRVDL